MKRISNEDVMGVMGRPDRSFTHFPDEPGQYYLDRKYPSYLTVFDGNEILLNKGDTHYVFSLDGDVHVQMSEKPYVVDISEGMYACIPARYKTSLMGGSGIVISRENYIGMHSMGGPIEAQGRLKYIDGCMDSLLIGPPKLGEPCLNALFFPPGVNQTIHSHPSDRIGVILSGSGLCTTPGGDTTLEEGMVFCIHANGQHGFTTWDQPMVVLAYHPETDFGPSDEDHPMLNRTMIDGISAANPDRQEHRTR